MPTQNLPTRTNNPGDLKDPQTGTFRQFSDPAQGHAALLNDLTAKMTGTSTTGIGPSSSLAEFAKVYAPPGDNNNSAKYAADLANQLRVSPATPIGQLKDRVGEFADAVAKNEGYQGGQSTQQPAQTTDTSGGYPVTKLNIPASQTGTPTQDGSITSDLTQGNFGGAAMKAGQGLLDFAFPIVGDIAADIKGTPRKSALAQAADIALSVLPFIPFVGEAGEAIRGAGLAGQAALGAGAGALQGVSQGEDLPGILGSAAVGGVTGGALSKTGDLVQKLAGSLPQSIIRRYIPGLSAEEAQYAATKTLGSPASMLESSNSDLSKLGASIGSALKKPQYDYVQPSTGEILQRVVNAPQLKDAGLSTEDIAANLRKILPLKKNLINKLISGQDMTLTELHSLNSPLGRATFKRVFDDPTIRAGKDIGSVVYHTINDVLKSSAPEIAPMFDNYSKEVALNAGLSKLVRSGEKSKAIGLKEILALMTAFSPAGPMGGATLYGIEKAATSPTVNLKAAGLLRGLSGKVSSPAMKKAGSSILPLISRGSSGLIPSVFPNTPQQ